TIGAEAVLSCKGGDVAGGNPTIALAAQSVTLTATAQGANPAAQTVAVTNGGTGSLIGLSVTSSYQTGQPAGWLAATLDQTTAPAMLTLQATTGALSSGSYSATVSVASAAAGNSPRTLTVTFTVGAGAAIYLLTTAVTLNAQVG